VSQVCVSLTCVVVVRTSVRARRLCRVQGLGVGRRCCCQGEGHEVAQTFALHSQTLSPADQTNNYTQTDRQTDKTDSDYN